MRTPQPDTVANTTHQTSELAYGAPMLGQARFPSAAFEADRSVHLVTLLFTCLTAKPVEQPGVDHPVKIRPKTSSAR